MILNKTVLKLDGVFLMLVGFVQIVFESLSHFMGTGPMADQFLHSPFTIGFFEAHGFAVLVGILLFRASARPGKFWHQFAVAVHLLLGGANLLFWNSFVQMDLVLPGILATLFHGAFIFLEAYCAWKKPPVMKRMHETSFIFPTERVESRSRYVHKP